MPSPTITFSKTTYKSQEALLISYPYHLETKAYIKEYEGVQWSNSLRCFYLPFSKAQTNALFLYLRKKKYYIDYSALKTRKQSPILRKPLKGLKKTSA